MTDKKYRKHLVLGLDLKMPNTNFIAYVKFIGLITIEYNKYITT